MKREYTVLFSTTQTSLTEVSKVNFEFAMTHFWISTGRKSGWLSERNSLSHYRLYVQSSKQFVVSLSTEPAVLNKQYIQRIHHSNSSWSIILNSTLFYQLFLNKLNHFFSWSKSQSLKMLIFWWTVSWTCQMLVFIYINQSNAFQFVQCTCTCTYLKSETHFNWINWLF